MIGKHTTGFSARLFTQQDYYPFGMIMPGRSYSAVSSYRFGFNNKEKDDEIEGDGNNYDYTWRIYDPRLAVFLSIDPLAEYYANWTPYMFAENRPIKAVDLNGLQAWDGPNDAQNVMSLESYRQFAKTLLTNATTKNMQFDCAHLGFYLLAKYYEYMHVTLSLNLRGKIISSGDLQFNSFKDFYNYCIYNRGVDVSQIEALSYHINPTDKMYGDTYIIPGDHVMIYTPNESDDANGWYSITQASGTDYGPNNPDTRTTNPTEYTMYRSSAGSGWHRFKILRDLPNTQSIPPIQSKQPTPVSSGEQKITNIPNRVNDKNIKDAVIVHKKAHNHRPGIYKLNR